MDNTFPKSEKLYRAVYPPDKVAMFWRRDGSISSAAFADPNGLSVDRGNFRSNDIIISSSQESNCIQLASTHYKKECGTCHTLLRI